MLSNICSEGRPYPTLSFDLSLPADGKDVLPLSTSNARIWFVHIRKVTPLIQDGRSRSFTDKSKVTCSDGHFLSSLCREWKPWGGVGGNCAHILQARLFTAVPRPHAHSGKEYKVFKPATVRANFGKLLRHVLLRQGGASATERDSYISPLRFGHGNTQW